MEREIESLIKENRQLDIHLMPLLCVLFVLSYLDRGNIGNAKTAGAQADLGLSSVQVRCFSACSLCGLC